MYSLISVRTPITNLLFSDHSFDLFLSFIKKLKSFSHPVAGIMITATVMFFIYCAVTRSKPTFPSKIVLPSILSGVFWGIGAFIIAVTFHFSSDSANELVCCERHHFSRCHLSCSWNHSVCVLHSSSRRSFSLLLTSLTSQHYCP